MIPETGNVKPLHTPSTPEDELRKELRTFSLTDLGFWVASGAATGAAVGALGLGAGAAPGAILGGLGGFLSYVGGYFTGLLTESITESPSLALSARRLAEIAMPTGYLAKFLRIAKLTKALPPPSEPVAPLRPVAKLVARTPKDIVLGLKAATFGLTTGYVIEPYIMRDPEAGEGRPLGLSALAASAWLISRPLAPLGLWAKYSTQQILSTLTPKAGAGVLVTEPITASIGVGKFKVSLERLRIPKLRFSFDKGFEVKAIDPFKEGLFYSAEQVADLEYRLTTVAKVLEKHGIRVGSPISRRLAVRLFDPTEEVELSRKIRDALKEEGLSDQAIAELSSALEEWQAVNLAIADQLASIGGASRTYLEALGGSRRFFQHILVKQREQITLEDLVSGAFTEKAPTALPSVASIRKRGVFLSENSAQGFALRSLFIKKEGRAPQVGDRLVLDNGDEWIYTPLKKGKRPGWWKETASPSKQDLVFDLAASLFVQLSQDLRLLRRLHVYNYLNELGKLTGHVLSDPARGKAAGFVKLAEPKPGGRGYSPVVKSFGNLTGKYVSPDLKRMLEAFVEMENYTPPRLPIVGSGLAVLNRAWKNVRLGLSIKSWQNAFIGNFFLSFAHGHDPAVVLMHAVDGFLKKDRASKAILEEAKKFGLFKGTFAWETNVPEEIQKIMALVRQEPEGIRRQLTAFYNWTSRVMTKGFGRIDEIWRFGLYRKLRFEGHSPQEAYRQALYAYGYYEDLPVVVRQLRDTITPFISFQFRVLPQVFKAFYNHPERLGFALAFVEAVQRTAFRDMYGEKWKEGMLFEQHELVKAQFLDFRPGGFLADFIRVPELIFEINGKELKIPSGYMYSGFIPWNIPLSVPHVNPIPGMQPINSWLATLFIQNPIIRFITGLVFHVDPATGRNLATQLGAGGFWTQVRSLGLTAWNTLSPFASQTRYLGELLGREGWDPIVAWFNYYGTYPNGEPVGTAHMIWNALAPAVMRFDPDFNVEMSLRRLEAAERAYKAQFNKALRRSAQPKVLESDWERLEYNLEELYKMKADLLERYFRAAP